IHEAERAFLSDAALNLSIVLPEPVVAPEPTATFRHGDRLELDGLVFEVRHTPGHSPGGACFYQTEHGVAFVGDALFAGSIGRYDFPTSDGPTLFRSIREQLLTLPDATRILPGHGPATTIGRERRTNPYLRDL
ncbi:MAG TPA: MBL fold metallo-hydrolase, partial [Phycisphaeraceae bacterium]